MTTPRVYILLPVHNRREITRRFVACLAQQSYRDYHLVLIDDGSSDGTAEMVAEQICSLTVIRGSGQWWWAGALHRGYQWLRNRGADPGDVVLIINDDTEFAPDFLEQGVAALATRRRALLLAHCHDGATGELVDAGVHIDWRTLRIAAASTPEEVNCLSTRGLFLRYGDFLELGGFFPRLLPHYMSDYEFTVRAHRRGMQLVTDPAVRLSADLEATGYRSFEEESFRRFLRRYFSTKSSVNPVHRTTFICLACPWRWKVLNLVRTWHSVALDIVAAARYSRSSLSTEKP